MDDDVDNMESTFSQQMREEYVSKKIGELTIYLRRCFGIAMLNINGFPIRISASFYPTR